MRQNIRNFSIIAHIDHGKSTLADRFLELTGTINKDKMRPQYLDMMDLEREKGITIKMQPVRMDYKLPESLKVDLSLSEIAILNLIDTPGHVDFSYEVSRSLAAVEGTILLVDATKGIQAQTLANLELAKKQNIVIIPAVNKIDSPNAAVEETVEELSNLLGVGKDEVIRVSAKLGTNVDRLLEEVLKKIPPPEDNLEKPFRALIFDSKYDAFKGVIAFVRVFDGEIKQGENIYLMAGKVAGEVKEVGFFKPILIAKDKLTSGEIGYIATGVKEPGKVRVGDTIVKIPAVKQILDIKESPLPGYKEIKPVVYASLYPVDSEDFDFLKDALSKLKLSDASLTFEQESKRELGRGFRCGFLGLLHAEIISERLKREFDLNLVVSTPSVVYKVIYKDDKEDLIYSAQDFPELFQVKEVREPIAKLEIMTPSNYLGSVLDILEKFFGTYVETKYLSPTRVLLTYEIPFREIITDFYDKLKGVTQGYASMNYEIIDYKRSDLVKVEVMIAGEKEEAFSKIVPEKRAHQEGSALVKKLKEILPPQQFSVALQACVGGKVIARETMSAVRKDVTGYLYGGDYTRKKKLLEKQKKGKKELKATGRVNIPAKVFLEMLRR